MIPQWLELARELQAIAQTGLTYTSDPYDIERYEAIREIAATILAGYSTLSRDQARLFVAADAGYATPKVDVRGVVFRADQILLVKERSDGRWSLPGGWADMNESPAEAAVREVYEESGFCTRAVKLLALHDRDKHPHPPHANHVFRLFFLCEITGGQATPSVETEAVDFFSADDLPELSRPRILPGQIARFFTLYRHPDWPTDFD